LDARGSPARRASAGSFQRQEEEIVMKTLMQLVRGFVREEEGTETVEWALVAGLIIVAAAASWGIIGGDVTSIIQKLATATTAADTAAVP
jgi:Flp pilus assembly pilin Flp